MGATRHPCWPAVATPLTHHETRPPPAQKPGVPLGKRGAQRQVPLKPRCPLPSLPTNIMCSYQRGERVLPVSSTHLQPRAAITASCRGRPALSARLPAPLCSARLHQAQYAVQQFHALDVLAGANLHHIIQHRAQHGMHEVCCSHQRLHPWPHEGRHPMHPLPAGCNSAVAARLLQLVKHLRVHDKHRGVASVLGQLGGAARA